MRYGYSVISTVSAIAMIVYILKAIEEHSRSGFSPYFWIFVGGIVMLAIVGSVNTALWFKGEK